MGNPPAHTLPQATPQVPPPQTTHIHVTLQATLETPPPALLQAIGWHYSTWSG